jgi:hypothetical protein
MHAAGFEPIIPGSVQPQTHALLDCEATKICFLKLFAILNFRYNVGTKAADLLHCAGHVSPFETVCSVGHCNYCLLTQICVLSLFSPCKYWHCDSRPLYRLLSLVTVYTQPACETTPCPYVLAFCCSFWYLPGVFNLSNEF